MFAFKKQKITIATSNFQSIDQLDGCFNSLVVAQTLAYLILQEKHLKILHIHRPVDQKYWSPFSQFLSANLPLAALYQI